MLKKLNAHKIEEGFVGQQLFVMPPDVKARLNTNELTKYFHVTAIGYYPRASHHDLERKKGSDEYILLYCVEGRGEILIYNSTIILTPNTFYILPKSVYHHYRSSAQNPWSIYWMHFTGSHADVLYNKYLQNITAAIKSPYNQNIVTAIEKLFVLIKNGFHEKNLEALNLQALNIVSSFLFQEELNPSITSDEKIKKSIKFMKQNIGLKYTLKMLAEQQNLSVAHYSRMFKADTGDSPANYYNKLKIQMSCQHLYFTQQSVKEISLALGFDDPYYFSRLFRKVMGMSPAKYRNEYKK